MEYEAMMFANVGKSFFGVWLTILQIDYGVKKIGTVKYRHQNGA